MWSRSGSILATATFYILLHILAVLAGIIILVGFASMIWLSCT